MKNEEEMQIANERLLNQIWSSLTFAPCWDSSSQITKSITCWLLNKCSFCYFYNKCRDFFTPVGMLWSYCLEWMSDLQIGIWRDTGTVSNRSTPCQANLANSKVLILTLNDLPFGECHFSCFYPHLFPNTPASYVGYGGFWVKPKKAPTNHLTVPRWWLNHTAWRQDGLCLALIHITRMDWDGNGFGPLIPQMVTRKITHHWYRSTNLTQLKYGFVFMKNRNYSAY